MKICLRSNGSWYLVIYRENIWYPFAFEKKKTNIYRCIYYIQSIKNKLSSSFFTSSAQLVISDQASILTLGKIEQNVILQYVEMGGLCLMFVDKNKLDIASKIVTNLQMYMPPCQTRSSDHPRPGWENTALNWFDPSRHKTVPKWSTF